MPARATARRKARRARVAARYNPNHGEHGWFASGDGGGTAVTESTSAVTWADSKFPASERYEPGKAGVAFRIVPEEELAEIHATGTIAPHFSGMGHQAPGLYVTTDPDQLVSYGNATDTVLALHIEPGDGAHPGGVPGTYRLDSLSADRIVGTFTGALRFNEFHDETGKFASSGSGGIQEWQLAGSVNADTANERADKLWSQVTPGGAVKNLDQKSALEYYHGGGYDTINSGLRFGDSSQDTFGGGWDSGMFGSDTSESKDWTTDLDVNLIDDAIHGSVTTKPAVVFRGISTEYSELQGLQPGDSFIDHGFASTSVLESVGQHFAMGTGKLSGAPLMEVQIPSGSHALYVGNMTNEAEVLLPRDSRYEVIGVQPDRVQLKVTTG